MRYEEAVAAAPPGWTMFVLGDIDLLPAAVRGRALRDVPVADLDAARVGDSDAAERIRRALFWTLVYQLRPELWEALAAAEPIHPRALRLVHELGGDRGRVVEVGAGSGRLTAHLLRTSQLIAIDASQPLLHSLRANIPRALPVVGWADALPVVSRWADAAVACASVGMDGAVIAELRRVTRPGGVMVLISPEPGDRQGWSSERFDPDEVSLPARDPGLDQIFGRPQPPSEVVWSTRT